MKYIALFFLTNLFLVSTSLASTCDVVPIVQWGGSASQRKEKLKTPVDLVVVTHTVTSECYTDDECERLAKVMRNTHMQMGFQDIALSFLVGGNGKIYEGAGWKVGSHTIGFNGNSVSLSFIGDFRNKLPTKKALDAAQNFLGCFLNTRYLGCEYSLVGHRQLIPTISPGDALQKHIQTWPHWTNTVPRIRIY